MRRFPAILTGNRSQRAYPLRAVRSYFIRKAGCRMANLTTEELRAITDQLKAEQLLVKKFKSYALMSTDAQIKTQCVQIAGKHQHHFDRLLSYLN